MDKKLETEIIDRFRKFFPSDEDMKDETISCLAFGFECMDGWYGLLVSLLTEISKETVPENFVIAQIKEKFGSLRFYVDNSTTEIYNIISKYEKLSETTCEVCGKTGKLQRGNTGWYSVRCDNCK